MHNLTPNQADRARSAVAEHVAESFRFAAQALQEFSGDPLPDPLTVGDTRGAVREALDALEVLDALGWPGGLAAVAAQTS